MIKVSARSEAKWSGLSRFHLGVSMGGGHHSGEMLEAIVAWINHHGFEGGMIDISDTLNRYNYMRDDIPELEAREISKRDGIKWELRNTETLSKLDMPVKLIHWDHWLQDDRFESYLHAFETAFNKNPVLKVALMQDIQRFYTRKFNQSLHERSSADIELSKRFYLEELAVLSIQFEDYPCVEIYPGRELDCLKVVRAGKVKNVPLGLQNAVYSSLFIHNDQGMEQTA